MAKEKILKLEDYIRFWEADKTPTKTLNVLNKLFMQSKIIAMRKHKTLNISERNLLKIIRKQNKIWTDFAMIKKFDITSFERFVVGLVPQFKNRINVKEKRNDKKNTELD